MSAVALVLVGSLVGCASGQDGGAQEGVETKTVTVEVRSAIDSSDIFKLGSLPKVGDPCESGADPSLHSGAQVTVKDAAGAIVGIGNLEVGKVAQSGSHRGNLRCVLAASIEIAELNGEFWTVEVGSHDYTAKTEELRSGVVLMVGDDYWTS